MYPNFVDTLYIKFFTACRLKRLEPAQKKIDTIRITLPNIDVIPKAALYLLSDKSMSWTFNVLTFDFIHWKIDFESILKLPTRDSNYNTIFSKFFSK